MTTTHAADVELTANDSDADEGGIFSGWPTLPPILKFDIESPGLSVYNAGGLLPWQYGYGLALGGLTVESAGTENGLGGVISLHFGALDLTLTNVQSYGNWLGSGDDYYYCLICNQFSVDVSGLSEPITAKLNIFTNALPQLELDTPWGDFGSALSNTDAVSDMLSGSLPTDFPAVDI
ncbi:MAG TPA: hypothetical protein VFQ37_14075 [Mycobacterium sp.]|nr:hypothetical protein [Mycobacterium sp.]